VDNILRGRGKIIPEYRISNGKMAHTGLMDKGQKGLSLAQKQ